MGGFFEFAGRLHPALVHLPIGILLLSVIFIWLNALNRLAVSHEIIRFTLGLGAICALASVATGLLLVRSGEHEGATVQWHQWMGIIVAATSVALWRIRVSLRKWTSAVMLVLIVVTGHLGASLTHGPTYLTEPFSESPRRLDITALAYDSAKIYSDVIAPIFEQNCYGCHGSTKQKGKLRLDGADHIMAGGKDGQVINAGNPQQSDLIQRLRLPLSDEDHMPPKEKRQPGEIEIELIALWIESGASFDQSLRSVISADEWHNLIADKKVTPVADVPTDEIEEADQQIISSLRSAGVSVSPVASNSNYLQLNFIGVPDRMDSLLPMIKGIADNIVWLKLGNTKLDDSMMPVVAACRNLRRLGIERTLVTDSGLANLSELDDLLVLNLAGTQTSMSGLLTIAEIKSLNSVNLYQTSIDSTQEEEVRKLFPNAAVEFGGYDVPALPTDTIVVKAK